MGKPLMSREERAELGARKFATELLMPAEEFREMFLKRGGWRSDVAYKVLSNHFGVPVHEVALRAAELKLVPAK